MKLCIVSRKGGVGKTTSAVHIAAGLVRPGNRVLLIDTDTQGHCSHMLGIAPGPGLGELITEGNRNITEARPGLDLLAGGPGLASIEREILLRKARQEYVLTDAVKDFEDRYGSVVIDCPPGFGAMGINALVYADKILVPISMEVLAIYGLAAFEEELDELRSLGLDVQIDYILPTFEDRRVGKTGAILQQLKVRYDDKVLSPIRCSTRFSELPAYGQTVFEFDPKGRGSEDYRQICREVS